MQTAQAEEKGVLWGKAFTWKIRGAGVEEIWRITGDFVGVDKWMTTLVQSSELVDGQPQQPGCVRRPVLYPASPGQPFTFAIEKLLLMDQHSHHYLYTILGGSTLPGFSLMQGYVSSFKLSSLTTPHTPKTTCNSTDNGATLTSDNACHGTLEEDATLLHWSFTCHPVSTLSEQDTHNIAFSLYEAAIKDLKKHLALPDNAITLLS